MERGLNHSMLQAPPVTFLEAAKALGLWVESVHQALTSEKICVVELEQMEEKLKKINVCSNCGLLLLLLSEFFINYVAKLYKN